MWYSENTMNSIKSSAARWITARSLVLTAVLVYLAFFIVNNYKTRLDVWLIFFTTKSVPFFLAFAIAFGGGVACALLLRRKLSSTNKDQPKS